MSAHDHRCGAYKDVRNQNRGCLWADNACAEGAVLVNLCGWKQGGYGCKPLYWINNKAANDRMLHSTHPSNEAEHFSLAALTSKMIDITTHAHTHKRVAHTHAHTT